MKYKITILFLFLVSCSTADDTHNHQPFDLKENSVESGEKITIPVPINNDENQTVYMPGDIPWVKSEYKVIFHHAEETKSYEKSHPSYPEHATLYDVNHPFLRDPLREFDSILIKGWLQSATEIAAFYPKAPSEDAIKKGYSWKYHYAGVYLPGHLEESKNEKVLHLFQCTGSMGNLKEKLYNLGEMYFSCKKHGFLLLRASVNTKTSADIKCQANLLQGDALDHCDYAEKYSIEAVSWVGDTKPTRNVLDNGFAYINELYGVNRPYFKYLCDINTPEYDLASCKDAMENPSRFLLFYQPSLDKN